MKKLFPLILLLMLSASLFAQTNRSSSAVKVAFVESLAFEDSKKGITRLVSANIAASHTDISESKSLSKRVDETKREINLLIADKKPINDKYLELKELEKQLAEADKAAIARAYENRSKTVTPLVDKIKAKLAEFAAAKGYAIIIDKSFNSFLVGGEIDDVTEEFIKFCNEAFDKEIE